MANDSDDEHAIDAHENDDQSVDLPSEKKIFFNHLDSYHGRNLARIFARTKPGVTSEVNEEQNVSIKHSFDEQPIDYGWKVSGTIQNQKDYNQPLFVQEVIHCTDRDELLDRLLEMNVIIYDITQDPEQVNEAVWVCQQLESLVTRLDHQITFILLSTVMTWAKTQPNEENVPFSEEDFRRRRAHPTFKDHHNAEKIITKLGLTNKKKLLTYIVATGLTYGMEENVFHYLFKSAWHNIPKLQVFGTGDNFLPTIHVIDLASVLLNLADKQFKTRYIVATDISKDTLVRLARKVSQTLGSGRVKFVDQEDAMLNKDITQTDYDMLSINMQFEPMFIKEQMNVKWHCETGLAENIFKIVEEYRIQRNLTPIKICILGPPASGKTTIAKQLVQEYQLHHLQIKDVIEETKYELEQLVKRGDDLDQNDEEEELDEMLAERIEEARSILDKLEDIRRDSKDTRLDDEILTQIFKIKLLSPPCQNQGYILDGYPKTFDQAQSLFAATNEEEEEQGTNERKSLFNDRTIPEFVFILEANNVYLRERVIHLPERMVAGTHNTEFEFRRRLKTYNDLGDDLHAGKFFEDIDRAGETFKIDDDRSINHRDIVDKMMERVQKPRNYGLTAEEEEFVKQKEFIEREKREREEREERERDEQETAHKRTKKQKEWTKKLEQVKDEECQILDAQAIPLRNYLMAHVMPTLTKALIECSRVRPDDPIDFVAEYLFKNNPQI